MKYIDLTGKWRMQKVGGTKSYTATIPGSVAVTLLSNRKIPDPYFADNEAKVLPVFDDDYVFRRDFEVDEGILTHDKVLLHCDGLDTLAEITLNGKRVATTDNMHRSYAFDIKDSLRLGENEIEIIFRSPTHYVRENPSKAGKPFSTLRKAACMFGWDWGPNLPDSGIWRDIYIESFDVARLNHIHIIQKHQNGVVNLNLKPMAEVWGNSVSAQVQVIDPDGTRLFKKSIPLDEDNCTFEFAIENPQLWWPVGYGSQPLYTIVAALMAEDGAILDHMEKRIGLRTLTHSRKKKEDGFEYAFSVNDVPIWFRGENLIIDDAILSRTDESHWRSLIDRALKSNLNGIRVWGGAYYPPNIFYQLCDEAGLMIFQDFMFACSFYKTSREFCENVRVEAEQNIQRICHHPCIALYCGNNEIESFFTVGRSSEPETVALRKLFTKSATRLPKLIQLYLWSMYRKIFLNILPAVVKKWAPVTGYVTSSPSVPKPGAAKSFYDYLSHGDMHYYLQYNDNAPYQKIRTVRSRFMTEIGFQSFPSVKTIAQFALERDHKPDSPIMYAHQKCKNGNEAIEEYMERDYLVPNNFADYVYLSQLQAAEIMRYTTEHFRRDSDYNRGMILWQFNDCWPVVSWSGVDYYGRWKALQYFIKRFYAPLCISAKDDGISVELWCGNESRNDKNGIVYWQLFDGPDLIDAGSMVVKLAAGKSDLAITQDYEDKLPDKSRAYLHFWLEVGDERVSGDGVLFVTARDHAFEQPGLELTMRETSRMYQVDVRAKKLARRVMLDTREGDCIFSDNWFDVPAGATRTVYIDKVDTDLSSLDALKDQLYATCLNEVMMRAAKW